MKVRTYLEFKKLNEKVDILLVLMAALVDEGSDRTEAKALAAKVRAGAEALSAAIPKQPT